MTPTWGGGRRAREVAPLGARYTRRVAMASLLAALSGTVTQLLSPAALERIPQHVAVIMDGSSRWARSRNVPRIAGHQAGVDALRTLIDGALELGCRA